MAAAGAGVAPAMVPLLSQVTLKASSAVSVEGVASATPWDDTIVRALGHSVPSAVWSAVTSVKLTAPKSDNGKTSAAGGLRDHLGLPELRRG